MGLASPQSNARKRRSRSPFLNETQVFQDPALAELLAGLIRNDILTVRNLTNSLLASGRTPNQVYGLLPEFLEGKTTLKNGKPTFMAIAVATLAGLTPEKAYRITKVSYLSETSSNISDMKAFDRMPELRQSLIDKGYGFAPKLVAEVATRRNTTLRNAERFFRQFLGGKVREDRYGGSHFTVMSRCLAEIAEVPLEIAYTNFTPHGPVERPAIVVMKTVKLLPDDWSQRLKQSKFLRTKAVVLLKGFTDQGYETKEDLVVELNRYYASLRESEIAANAILLGKVLDRHNMPTPHAIRGAQIAGVTCWKAYQEIIMDRVNEAVLKHNTKSRLELRHHS